MKTSAVPGKINSTGKNVAEQQRKEAVNITAGDLEKNKDTTGDELSATGKANVGQVNNSAGQITETVQREDLLIESTANADQVMNHVSTTPNDKIDTEELMDTREGINTTFSYNSKFNSCLEVDSNNADSTMPGADATVVDAKLVNGDAITAASAAIVVDGSQPADDPMTEEEGLFMFCVISMFSYHSVYSDEARSEATFRYKVEGFSKLRDTVLSGSTMVRNLPW